MRGEVEGGGIGGPSTCSERKACYLPGFVVVVVATCFFAVALFAPAAAFASSVLASPRHVGRGPVPCLRNDVAPSVVYGR